LSRFVDNVLDFGGVFDLHVAKFLGVKDLTTFKAFDEFDVVVPRDDSNSGMSAGGRHCFWYGALIPLFPADCSRLFEDCKLNFGTLWGDLTRQWARREAKDAVVWVSASDVY
jgi:hypothetical protein